MNQQDLIWIKVPFSNLQESKIRPALIVSSNSYNSKSQDIIICSITSKLKEDRYGILIDNKNLSKGNLPVKSRVRADKILHIEKELAAETFATLDDRTFDKIVDKIKELVSRA